MRFSERLRHLQQLSPRFLIAAVLLAAVPGHGQDPPSLYRGGTIISYNSSITGGYSTHEEVLVEGGKITVAGPHLGTLYVEHMFPDLVYKDLHGKTMIPGFFDGHSHFIQVAYLPMFADLLPPPDGTVTSIKGIQEGLIAHRCLKGKMTVNIKGKEWEVLLGNGYDDSRLFGDGDSTKPSQGQPTRQQLDEVSEHLEKKYENKKGDSILICIFHQSGHYSVCNSAALSAAGYHDGAQENPDGGTIYRDKNLHMTGLLGESAHIQMLLTVVPPIKDQTLIDGLDLYTSQGFTTVEDGRVSPAILDTLNRLSHKFSVDVVAYPDLQMVYANKNNVNVPLPTISRTYENGGHYRTGGVKLTLDGSPQGRSAWLTEPYLKAPDGEETGVYRGQGNIPDVKTLEELMVWAFEKQWQVLLHANGDAAIDQLIVATRAAEIKVPNAVNGRTVMVHGQFLRDHSIDKDKPDQIAALGELQIFPSLFPMHTYYWGDWYRQIVGDKRAYYISPTKAVQDAQLMFSIHSDAPVTKPNSMRLLDSAVNRTTRGGTVLGAGQKISPLVALKAMTIWPAYQHFEDTTKGTIDVGKRADFVILYQNPLTVPNKDLICIQIYQTIKDGRPVYTNEDTAEKSMEKFKTCADEQTKRNPTH